MAKGNVDDKLTGVVPIQPWKMKMMYAPGTSVGKGKESEDEDHEHEHGLSAADTVSLTYMNFDIDLESKRGRKVPMIMLKMLAFTLAGILFGWCAQKGMVYEPIAIRLQFVFQNFDMMKMFLGAAAAGQLVFFVMYFASRRLFYTVRNDFLGCIECKGMLGSGLGAAILGAGMVLGGGCPGMVLAQLGSGVPYAYITLLGCFAGALFYGFVEKPLLRVASTGYLSEKHSVVEGLFNTKKTPLLLILFALALSGVVVMIELLSPWSADIATLLPPDLQNTTEGVWGNYVLDAVSWPPAMVGVIIGLLQLPITLLVGESLGSSTSYMMIISQWVHALPERHRSKFPQMSSMASQAMNPEKWWQVFYVVGAVLGSLISATLSGTYGRTANGVFPLEAFFGGMLMLFGSRFAAGCTSGHGLSGMALLISLSFVAVPCMFAGGIITGFAMQAAGNITPSVHPTW
eukprot:CAMPEP_0113872216 /NCGR_PEP_ID=MMETSP0780_2-20120614/3081_1 /TAXON_ID=652834 /ORGANISM="Palpitomonas bilix" /LENGTH=458 /DNA_ID=CAMNT_0000857705 /DNA_START=140 /DNA_END=1513 /DNA_ORIENTATION=- /assembly_acc=CAM_ASM_000599